MAQGARGRRGRTLDGSRECADAYVQKAGIDLGQHQVNRGRAKVHVFERPAFRRVEKYRAAQRRAVHHNRGVWRHCSHF